MSDSPQYTPVPTPQAQTGLTDNAAGALAYVTIIPAIVFLVMEPYNKSSYVRFHAWQSIFLLIPVIASWIVLMIIGFIPVLNLVDLILGPVIWLGFLILWIILVLKALKGEKFKLPFIGDLATKQAGE